MLHDSRAPLSSGALPFARLAAVLLPLLLGIATLEGGAARHADPRSLLLGQKGKKAKKKTLRSTLERYTKITNPVNDKDPITFDTSGKGTGKASFTTVAPDKKPSYALYTVDGGSPKIIGAFTKVSDNNWAADLPLTNADCPTADVEYRLSVVGWDDVGKPTSDVKTFVRKNAMAVQTTKAGETNHDILTIRSEVGQKLRLDLVGLRRGNHKNTRVVILSSREDSLPGGSSGDPGDQAVLYNYTMNKLLDERPSITFAKRGNYFITFVSWKKTDSESPTDPPTPCGDVPVVQSLHVRVR